MKWQSTGNWTPVQINVAEAAIASTETYELDRTQWPNWALSSTQTQRMFLYGPDEGYGRSVSGSTVAVIGRLLTERYDPKDTPLNYNYDIYLLTESTGGVYHQSPPIRTSELIDGLKHHSSGPPALLDSCGPAPI